MGRAPAQPAPGAGLTVAEQNAHATNLELAKNAGSRYLVQRWGDGTLCDKTGRNREVEVQVKYFRPCRSFFYCGFSRFMGGCCRISFLKWPGPETLCSSAFSTVPLFYDYDRSDLVCQGNENMFICSRH